MIQLFAIIAAITSPADAAVTQHWKSYAHGAASARYLSLEEVPEADRGRWHNALMFSVSSASKDVSLENHLPKRLADTMTYYIDLDALKWDYNDLNKVLEKYPYAVNDPHRPLLVFRGDWLIYQLHDTRDSLAQYLLLYGEKNIPKNDDDFLRYWGVDAKAQDNKVTIGWVEDRSQVNPHGTRYVERYITAGEYSFGLSLWRTKDSFFVTAVNDPLETLDGSFLHQGRELIAQFPKSHRKNGKLYRGAAQAYMLAAGNAGRDNKPLDAKEAGKRVEEAPVDLVRDFNRCLDQDAIINQVSCVVCHDAGMKFPTTNALEGRLRMGVELHVYDRGRKEQAEEFHLTNAAIELEQDNRRYAAFVEACTGLKTPELSQLIFDITNQYRKPLSLADAARELHCSADDLRHALAWASANKIVVGNQLSALAHGRPIPRTQFEEDYLRAAEMVRYWRAGTPQNIAGVFSGNKNTTPGLVEMRLIVSCPKDAIVFIGRRQMQATGERREFTAQVKPDWRATMIVTAVLVVDGQEVRDSREVECEAGKTVEIAFEFKHAEGQS